MPCRHFGVSRSRPLGLETAIVAAYLTVLSRHPDSLIVRKAGLERASRSRSRAAEILAAGWPDQRRGRGSATAFDELAPATDRRRYNPGTTADLVTAALYAALRDGTIPLPLPSGSWDPLRDERSST